MALGQSDSCPFCREQDPSSDEEEVKRIEKLMDNGNADAFNVLANSYSVSDMGMQQDLAKANELWLKAGGLGCAEAYGNLGHAYEWGRGVAVDKKKAKHYRELAAMGGNSEARASLACIEGNAGNHHRAYRHYAIAARAGQKQAMEAVKIGCTMGLVTTNDYETILRAYQKIHDEMKSDARDKVQEQLEGM